MQTATELLDQFQNMKNIPIVEINWADYDTSCEEDDYEVFNLFADLNGIHCDDYNVESVEWDGIFSLDQHLQAMLENILDLRK